MSSTGIDYVICAAGQGVRLQSLSLNIPKPILKLKGVTLLERSLQSLDISASDRLIIITQKAHEIASKMDSFIRNKFLNIDLIWLEIDKVTSGQLETAHLASSFLRGQGVVIFNSDTYFRSSTLMKQISDLSLDGIIPCSNEQGSEWSFCKLNEKFDVVQVTEKNRISDLASVGYYFFRKSSEMLHYSELEIETAKKNVKECYVAPVYNRMIHDGKKIAVNMVDEFRPMGTPTQVQTYWKISFEEFMAENRIG